MTSLFSDLKLRTTAAFLGVPFLVCGLLYLPYFSIFFCVGLCFLMFFEWVMLWRYTKKTWVFAGGCLYLISPFLLVSFFVGRLDAVLLISLSVAWMTDIGGYFTGKLLAGPKLCPKISPKKTWAGAIGGVGCTAMYVYMPFYQRGSLLFFIFLSCFAQLGDLIESWAKRRLFVKESGAIIPGHGGILDRFDSFVGVLYGFFLWMLYEKFF